MDGVASAAMTSDKVALGFDDGADDMRRHRRTTFWMEKAQLPFSVIKSTAGGNCEAGSAGVPAPEGSYLTPSGGTGDGLGGRRTVPTASGARRNDPRCGKGVNTKSRAVPEITQDILRIRH